VTICLSLALLLMLMTATDAPPSDAGTAKEHHQQAT
jgi:hypothetical protein